MFQEPTFKVDREKLKDVVHYICSKCNEPSELGNVKLHKILYFADMLHYKATLKPLTGVEYRKQQFGPVALHLSWAIGELEREGRITVGVRDYFGFEKKEYISLAPPPPLGNFAPGLLDDVIDFVRSHSAKEISELSHNAAWSAAGMGEVIPYFSVLAWEPAEVTEDDIAWGVGEANRLKAEIEAEVGAR